MLLTGKTELSPVPDAHLAVPKQCHGVRMLVTGPHQGFHLTEVDMFLKYMKIYMNRNIYIYAHVCVNIMDIDFS